MWCVRCLPKKAWLDFTRGRFDQVRCLQRSIFGTNTCRARLGPNIVRVLPSTCVTFLIYENTKIYLPKFYSKTQGADDETAA